MALLGFDALGRLAIGQLPAPQPLVLLALQATYAAGGRPATHSMFETASGASVSVSGGEVRCINALSAPSGGFAVAGLAASFSVPLSAVTTNYSTNYKGAVSLLRYAVASATYTFAPRAVPFAVSTGAAAGGAVIVGYDADVVRGYEAWFAHPIDADQWSNDHPLKEDGWLSAARPMDRWTVEPSTVGFWDSLSVAAGSWTKT